MRAIQVVASIKSATAGPTYSVGRLCEVLHEAGHEVELHTLEAGETGGEFNVVVHEPSPFAMAIGRSPSMSRTLRARAGEWDIFHSHGLWMCPNLYPAWAAGKTGTKLVVSPRGALNPPALAISRARKQVMWIAVQHRALQRADMFHATSQAEAEAIRSAGFHQPIALIPNGSDVPPLQPMKRRRIVLYLGRLHRHKGVDRLVESWASLEGRFPDWTLRIVGPDADRKHTAMLKRLSARLDRVEFVGQVVGERKIREYQRAGVCVLPSDSENFGMSIAESLACGTPVIATQGAPWRQVTAVGCGWWVEPTVVGVERALTEAMELDLNQLSRMGARGREWISREYRWDRVGEQMAEAYKWIKVGGPTPNTIL